MSALVGNGAGAFLLETLIWTAVLIGFVLLVRRPVARWFGPQMAYALWALPMVRLLMPPIELPAWLAPVEEAAPASTATASDAIVIISTSAAVPQSSSASWLSAWLTSELLTGLVLALWLIGAAVFLFQRFYNYGTMRRDMLADCIEVGRDKDVRLVETPATNAPLAFGVRSKIVALPIGFMAQPDQEVRDLALAHELAHHRGRDLLINFLVQPLFALHWFNPLGRLGWLALRRDQEAACDARVMAQRAPAERASYAQVIAGFATGPDASLAAPMACPVLGDKSIIQRLRSLQMDNVSRRRRIFGKGLLVASAIALPLTASISYAEGISPTAPSAPLPPQPPVAAGLAVPIAAPVPPASPLAPSLAVGLQSAPEGEALTDDKEFTAVLEFEEKVEEGADEKRHEKHKYRAFLSSDESPLSEAEREKIIAQVRESLAMADRELSHIDERIKIEMKHISDGKHHTRIETDCTGEGVSSTSTGDDGKTVVKICKSKIFAEARAGLVEARKSLANNSEMPPDVRKQVLEALDEQIENWADKAD